jgi:FlaA1/EpsC-like NDP-sugar epimerase
VVLFRFQSRLIRLSGTSKRLILGLCDSVILIATLVGTLLLIHQGDWAPVQKSAWMIPLVALAGVPLLASQGLYRAIIRFVGEEMLFAVLRGVTLLTVTVLAADILLFGHAGRTLSAGIVFWAFAVLGLTGSRLTMRALVSNRAIQGERVAIYGAGKAGLRLVSALAGSHDCTPVLFVDDNPMLRNRVIAGLPVAASSALPQLIGELGIRRVLLALPSVSRRKRQEIIASLEHLPVRVQTVPDIADLLSGQARVDDIRDVDVADLLGREAVPPNSRLLDACIAGKSVMVTGAGGSIGSELCRQIVRLKPARLVLLELSEPALFSIDLELRRAIAEEGVEIELLPVLGSVHHRARIYQVMRNFHVQTVYHAAAYKHVPLVEYNLIEGVHNNIIGTWHTAEAACDAGVGTFVLVSTDKAVLPANVMGATKRFAELVLQAMSVRQSTTRFCMVRFGNVLDSSGSVVPVFREQIRRGGPVTVTHRDIVRYFMTIPEAAQLVLQAGSMSQGGDVFVLDMGKPVRIADLARRMINLMGLTVRDDDNPDGDIAIEYTGLRPAEKLYEELLIGTNVTGTGHPMIMRAMEESLDWSRVQHYIEQFLQASARSDCERARELLVEAVAGYKPTNGVDDLVWKAGLMVAAGMAAGTALATVTELASRRALPPAN